MRSRLLLLALLVAFALPAQLAAQIGAAAPRPGTYTISTPDLPFIAGSSRYRLGGFSGLYYIGGNEFWTITDRGPNVDSGDAKVFPLPYFQPLIFKLRLLPNGTMAIVQTIPLNRPDGGPVSGRPNPAPYSTGEVALDTLFNTLPADEWGFDTEALLRSMDGTFWFAEEYAPGIAHVAANGTIIERVRPQPSGGLPDVLKKHVANRGMEGLAQTPNGKLYTIVQSGMANSYANTSSANNNAANNTELLRLVEYDPATGQVRMFAYMMDAGYAVSGSNVIRRRDIKIGDLAALNNDELLILEHAQRGPQNAKKIHRISLVGATPLTTEVFETSPGVFRTLEELTRAELGTVAGITPVGKTLVLDMLNPGLGNPVWPTALDKPEGMTLINGSTIVVCNDNDFGVLSPNADGIITLTGNPCIAQVYSLQTPLNYQMGAAGSFLSGQDTLKQATGLFSGSVSSCTGELPVSVPITIRNTSPRDLVLTGAEFYTTDTVPVQGTPRYPILRDGNGNARLSQDYVITAAPAVAPLSSNPSPFPVVVAPGTTRTLYVTLLAQRKGRRFARGFISTNAQNQMSPDKDNRLAGGLVSFDVYGVGVGPRLASSPGGAAFGPIVFGPSRLGEWTEKNFTMHNVGHCDLRISLDRMEIVSGDVDEFMLVRKPTGATDGKGNLVLPPGGSATGTIRFKPSQVDSRRASLRLLTNDSSVVINGVTERGEYYLDLFGSGKSDLYADAADLGTALIGGGPAEHRHGTVRLRNTLNGPMIVSKLLMEGTDAADFSADPAKPWPTVLPMVIQSGQNLELSVVFAPGSGTPGPREAAVKIILDNGDTVTAKVTGVAGTRTIIVAPNVINFSVSPGRQARKAVTIRNTGTMALKITGMTLGNPDFSVTTLARIELAPGQVEQVEVTFAPQGQGTSTGSLVVESNGTNGQQDVALNGTASTKKKGDDPSSSTYRREGGGEVVDVAGEFSISGVTGVRDASGMALLQSVPNPARDVVEIGWVLPVRGEMELALYDAQGRTIRVMERGIHEAGEGRVRVDVSGLANGVYHYRLIAGGRMLERTMVVVR